MIGLGWIFGCCVCVIVCVLVSLLLCLRDCGLIVLDMFVLDLLDLLRWL